MLQRLPRQVVVGSYRAEKVLDIPRLVFPQRLLGFGPPSDVASVQPTIAFRGRRPKLAVSDRQEPNTDERIEGHPRSRPGRNQPEFEELAVSGFSDRLLRHELAFRSEPKCSLLVSDVDAKEPSVVRQCHCSISHIGEEYSWSGGSHETLLLVQLL